jgi:hypothetical protein
MRDFAHRTSDYAGWNEERRRSLFARLVGLIVKAKPVPVGCVVSLSDFHAAPPKLKEFYLEPYFMAFQDTTRGAALQALPKNYPFECERVDMVYAYQSEFGATDAQPESRKGAPVVRSNYGL